MATLKVRARYWPYWAALLWTLMWLAGQVWCIYLQQSDRFSNLPETASNGWKGIFTSATLPGILWYFVLLALLHIGFALANASAFRTVLAPWVRSQTAWLPLLAQLLLVTLAVSLLATWIFPSSAVGDRLAPLLYQVSGRVIAGGLILCTLLYFLAWTWLKCVRSRVWRVSAGFFLLAGVLATVFPLSGARADGGARQPDVVVVGIDSLRPDHLFRNGAPFKLMPNVEKVLADSVVFTDVLSPQPHTFPATVSILTGQWPVNHGARGNLFPANLVRHENSIAHLFEAAGYETVFAMDESRFANIDESYGFQHVISPGFGIGELTMGVIGDTVLTNLLSLAPVSIWLLPDVYGNRALAAQYRPAAFSRRLEVGLSQVPSRKPLFLYVHFCAGHWPYIPSSLYQLDEVDRMGRAGFEDTDANYLRGLKVADKQVGRLLDQLRASGRLNNAIVSLLSDHGEDFDMKRDRWPDSLVAVPGGIVNGHGGSAIRDPQTSVVLAFSRHGAVGLPSRVDNSPASLVDVAPTLLSLAGLQAVGHEYDGVDLLAGNRQYLEDRIRFVESSYFPDALKQRTIDEARVLRETAEMYQVVPSGRIEVKPGWLDFQRRYRQRAAYQYGWALMASDDPDAQLLVINRRDRRGWPLDHAPDSAPVKQLRLAWCSHWRLDPVISPHCR